MTPNRPPAAAPAGSAQAGGASGRKGREPSCTCGPMRVCLFAFLLVVPLGLSSAPALAQKAPAAPAAAAAAAANPPTPEWRRTDGYRFPPLADSVRRLQYTTLAMQLREYCADRRVSDDFVRERLQRFGRITGRAETCASLRDY
jgi:hypothetical protein